MPTFDQNKVRLNNGDQEKLQRISEEKKRPFQGKKKLWGSKIGIWTFLRHI